MLRLIQGSTARALAVVAGLHLAACASAPVGGGPSPDARLESILSGFDERSVEDLARDLRTLSLDSPRHRPTLVADAALSIETGRTDRATALLEQVLAAEPDHVDAVLLSTRVAARNGDVVGARRRVERALRTRPDAAGLHEADAALLYLEDRHGEAIEALDRADLLRGEASWRSAYHRGLVAEATGDLSAAEEHYARCEELEPSFEPAGRRLRWIAAQRGDDGR